MFPEALNLLNSRGATNIQLDLTTLEQVFLETGKEDVEEEDLDNGKEIADEEVPNGNDDIEDNAGDSEGIAQIWEQRCKATPVGWWKKLFLVQNFMMVNAWKMNGIIFLNIISCPEGLWALHEHAPAIKVVTAEVDTELDDKKYIIPGVGDFGDRYFGTV